MRPPHPPDSAPFLPAPPFRGFARPGMGRTGLALFLFSATALFIATLVAYLFARALAADPPPTIGPPAALELPRGLYASTAVLLVVAAIAELTRRAANRRAEAPAKLGMAALLTLASAFIAIQTPALLALLSQHESAGRTAVSLNLFAFILILIHAAHVVGGMLPLLWLAGRAVIGRFNAADHDRLALTAAYWHYLDAVWLVLFATLLLTA